MAQQVFTQWAPVAKAQNEQGQEVYLPFAGIHAQTRDGKDEVIFGAGAMVWDPDAGENGMWVPVDAANPMEVRVRQLEAQIAALQQFLEGRLNADLADVLARLNTDLSTRASEQTLVQARDALSALAGTVDAGAQKVTLTGQKAAQTILPREIRAAGTSVYRRTVTPPIGAKGCRLELSVFGVTGQFGSGEGISLLYREHTDAIPAVLVGPYETTKTRGTGNNNQHLIMVYPGLSEENGGVFLKVDGVLGRRLVVQVNINGTFAAGEGFDCQLDVVWIM